MKKPNEIQSRREFFKKAAKGVLPILGLVMLPSSAQAMLSQDENETPVLSANAQDVKEIGDDWSVVPKLFSFSGKPILVTKDDQVVSVYDDDLNVVHTFNVQEADYTNRTEQQARKPEVESTSADQPVPDSSTGEAMKLTWEEAKKWGVDESQYNRVFYTEAHDNYQLWPDDDSHYYLSRTYGRTYPTRYYQWNAEDGTINMVSVSYKHTGDWETVETYEYRADTSIKKIEFEDYDDNSYPDNRFIVSQTLFKNDEKFEYLTPAYKSEERISGEYDSDGDGTSDGRTVEHGWSFIGYKVLNEDGETILELDVEGSAYIIDEHIIKLNGNLYLEADGDFYKIDSQSISIQQVRLVPASLKARYSVDGRRLSSPESGVNILLKEDGTTVKQFVK